jgi:hypothetical protein
MMRVYLAGPMTGLPELNFPAFHRAAANLRASGFEVVNPAEINPDPAAGWTACMRQDIAQLVTCQAIALLPGWRSSRGAQLEHHIATHLEMLEIHIPLEKQQSGEAVIQVIDEIESDFDREWGEHRAHMLADRRAQFADTGEWLRDTAREARSQGKQPSEVTTHWPSELGRAPRRPWWMVWRLAWR